VVVSGLRKGFRGHGGHLQQVLRGVDLAARPGEVTTLLGTNGAGKSTTLACAQGLLHPDAGEVRLLGASPWRAGAALRARVGVMLQDGGLPPGQKPLSYLRHVAGLYAAPRNVDELAERLGITEFAGTGIRRLSGGQRQRVALAVALVGDPEVLFLDEPSAGLDPVSRQVVFDLIGELREQGRAVVLTTHLLQDAERLSDIVYIIDHGRTVAHGSVAELVGADGPGDLHVSFSPGEDPGLPDGITAQRTGADSWMIPGLAGPEVLAALTAHWAAHGVVPHGLRLRRRSLEEAFLALAETDDDLTTPEQTQEVAS